MAEEREALAARPRPPPPPGRARTPRRRWSPRRGRTVRSRARPCAPACARRRAPSIHGRQIGLCHSYSRCVSQCGARTSGATRARLPVTANAMRVPSKLLQNRICCCNRTPYATASNLSRLMRSMFMPSMRISRWAAAPRRVQVAFVVEIGGARRELVRAHGARLAGLAFGRGGHQLVVRHLGLARGLAVDRPRRPVVMRRRVLRSLVAVREQAEAEIRVLVEHLALRRGVVEVGVNERPVAQQLLEPHADLAAPGGARLGTQDGAALGRELLEGWRHVAIIFDSASSRNPGTGASPRPGARRSARPTARSSRATTKSSDAALAAEVVREPAEKPRHHDARAFVLHAHRLSHVGARRLFELRVEALAVEHAQRRRGAARACRARNGGARRKRAARTRGAGRRLLHRRRRSLPGLGHVAAQQAVLDVVERVAVGADLEPRPLEEGLAPRARCPRRSARGRRAAHRR